MRLELEKKQQEEENVGDQMADNQGQSRALRDISGLTSMMETAGNDARAMPGVEPSGSNGGFTTLHYENHDVVGPSVVTTSCQPEVPGTREDSLDLYAIRDDCYASEDAVDGSQSSVVQRKLHPEFSQAFQNFSGDAQSAASTGSGGGGGGGGGGMSFQQSYQDYGSPYVTGLQSASRIPQFQPAPQFQSPPNPVAFAHYGPHYGAAGQDGAAVGLPASCAQMHHVTVQQQQQQPPPPPPALQQQQQQQQQQQRQQQHSSYDHATVFAQEDIANSAQYTNLTSSVQPMNTSVVQQMQQGKLEPFSELLNSRYSYYGEMHESQQHHGTYGGHASHGSSGKITEVVESEPVASEQQLPSESTPDDCDENFGEIIKKSMVETVSA